ncbi:relaxase/mobilization nuclease domain-containing protein [Eubacteriales bacterium mix99]
MAVTKIIPIRFTIEKSVDYICNQHKTGDCLYIHSEHCVPQMAALTFRHHLDQARAGGNTIGRHLIQSFAPGEVSPEVAHEIGKKLASETLGGKHAFVMATHVDRGHIHNHFVWGVADVETHKKYHSNKRSYHDIRDASDRLCEEYSLSVIAPQGVGKSYTEYHAKKEGTSWKAKLKAAIMRRILYDAE